eukprot:TRINITY_DN3091_c0_g1_i1.p1 TRINITY_DN3091_c0_g1~~TRINITY_DN3091_c0_g1_i1.p1  ORF type:complete len:134 (-),score=15.35 TRINITY_DN3091_c0_g1_i1:37-438(-)
MLSKALGAILVLTVLSGEIRTFWEKLGYSTDAYIVFHYAQYFSAGLLILGGKCTVPAVFLNINLLMFLVMCNFVSPEVNESETMNLFLYIPIFGIILLVVCLFQYLISNHPKPVVAKKPPVQQKSKPKPVKKE